MNIGIDCMCILLRRRRQRVLLCNSRRQLVYNYNLRHRKVLFFKTSQYLWLKLHYNWYLYMKQFKYFFFFYQSRYVKLQSRDKLIPSKKSIKVDVLPYKSYRLPSLSFLCKTPHALASSLFHCVQIRSGKPRSLMWLSPRWEHSEL